MQQCDKVVNGASEFVLVLDQLPPPVRAIFFKRFVGRISDPDRDSIRSALQHTVAELRNNGDLCWLCGTVEKLFAPMLAK